MIHVEVQGEDSKEFPERMYQYFARIYDKYKREIVAFAVMTGAEESSYPTTFSYSYFGTSLHYAYNVYKIRDADDKELEQSTNLFSKVILAAKYRNETKGDEEQRYAFKVKLMREIIKLDNQSRVSIQAVFYFIDYLLQLPETLTKQLNKAIDLTLKKEAEAMNYTEYPEYSPTMLAIMELRHQRGLKEGEERGFKEGEERGLREGKEEERRNLALALLHEDFSDEHISKLTKLDVEEVAELRKTL